MPMLTVGGLFVGDSELPKLQELGFPCGLQRQSPRLFIYFLPNLTSPGPPLPLHTHPADSGLFCTSRARQHH